VKKKRTLDGWSGLKRGRKKYRSGGGGVMNPREEKDREPGRWER